MLKPIIRSANLEDLHRIVEIYNSTIPLGTVTADTEPITVESREHWFYDHQNYNYPLWVAEQDKKVIGWLSFKRFQDRYAFKHTAELSLYLDFNYRGQSLGKLLLNKAIATSPELDIKTLLAFVFSINTPSLKLLKQHGFEQWGYLPEIAEIKGENRDVIILGKKII